MGKMKRRRQKLHVSAKNSKAKMKNESKGEEEMCVDPPQALSSLQALGCTHPTPFVDPSAPGNPFSGLKINTEALKQNLADLDAKSTVTSKSFKGLGLKKKDKQKVRHQLWMEKVGMLQAEKERKRKERKRKEKTAVVGDLTDLQETLPTLELLLKKTTGKPQLRPVEKPKGIQNEKRRRKQMMDFHRSLSGATSPRILAEDTQQVPSPSHRHRSNQSAAAAPTPIAEHQAEKQQRTLSFGLTRPRLDIDLAAQKQMLY